jgi:hypothetical protein
LSLSTYENNKLKFTSDTNQHVVLPICLIIIDISPERGERRRMSSWRSSDLSSATGAFVGALGSLASITSRFFCAPHVVVVIVVIVVCDFRCTITDLLSFLVLRKFLVAVARCIVSTTAAATAR